MTAKKHERMLADIERHGRQLLALYPNASERDPVRLCKKLLAVERKARQYTTDYCNGDIRPDEDYANIRELDGKFLGMARAILGKGGPALVINHDPRGCALKIDSDNMACVELYRDMDGNGIIAPTFDGNNATIKGVEMIKVTISFETKKNNTVTTIWGIRQNRPYPTVVGSCGTLKWENGGGLFPQWRPCDMEKPGIGSTYRCDLLRSDMNDHDLRTRVSSAGYDPNNDGKANPGTFALRGVDLGEMAVEFGDNPEWPDIKVRGFNRPSQSERDFIKVNIIPALHAAVEQNRAALKKEAISELRAMVAERLEEAREKLVKMEKEINAAIDIAAK